MPEKLVPIYRAFSMDDAQRLADYLHGRGIESYVDDTQSPVYGVSESPKAHMLYVDSHIAGYGREVVREYARQFHGGMRGWSDEEAEYESEVGMELPTRDRPSDDSPADSAQDQQRTYGTEVDDEEIPGRREAPEVEDLIDEETGLEETEQRIVRFGPDHDLAEEDDFEFVGDEYIDEADTRQGIDEEEEEESG